MAGVQIENGAIIAAGSIVTKHTHIKSGEVWGGIPAKNKTKSNASFSILSRHNI